MNDGIKEQISAYVDGELSATESELLVRRLSQSAELRAQAAAYMSLGRAVRGEAEAPGLAALRERIAASLDSGVADESAVVPLDAPVNRWLRPVAGVGIAATVAVVALLALQTQAPVADPDNALASNDLAALAIDEAPFYTEPPLEDVANDRPGSTLTRYYEQHNERAAGIGASGVLSRLVELELRGDELELRDGELVVPEDNADDESGIDGPVDERPVP